MNHQYICFDGIRKLSIFFNSQQVVIFDYDFDFFVHNFQTFSLFMRSQNCTRFVYVVTFNVISPYTQEKLTETKCVIRRETDNAIGKRKKGAKVQTMIHKTLCRKLNIILRINHKKGLMMIPKE